MTSLLVSSTPQRPIWSIRLLLAALLLFSSEMLAWTNPPGRTLPEWLLIVPGYIVLSAVVLDFIVRYRVRDLFGALVLAGIYSLSAALIINPQSMLSDMPRTLVTRVMGAHGLLTVEMIGLFLALTGGDQPRARRNLLIGCAVVGLAWGFWVKGWPIEMGYGEVSLVTMLIYGGAALALILLLFRLVGAQYRGSPERTIDDLRLSRIGWGVAVIALGALFIVRLLQGFLEGGALTLVVLLLVLSWAIVWFRGRTKGRTLLDGRYPPQPLSLSSFFVAAALFLGVAIFVYNLPPIQVADITPVTLIGLGFTAYGLAWLPTVSLVLGAQAYLRQIQTRKL